MISRLHDKLGTAGLVVAIVALVAAMSGAAIAAGGLSTAEKKEIKKQSKKFSNKFAKKYAKQFSTPGPQGAQGAAGAQGNPGATGLNGTNGTNGATGEAGVCSVTIPECTLPSGATLVGAWGVIAGENGPEAERDLVEISFNLSVSPAPTALTIAKLGGLEVPIELVDGGRNLYGPNQNPENPGDFEENMEAFEAACPGTADDPEAAPGFLCIYNGTIEGSPSGPFNLELGAMTEAANEYGIVVPYQLQPNESIRGSWAVTAE